MALNFTGFLSCRAYKNFYIIDTYHDQVDATQWQNRCWLFGKKIFHIFSKFTEQWIYFTSNTMPCPFTCPKMFWASPVFFGQTKNCIIFSADEKIVMPAQKLNLMDIAFCSGTKFLGSAQYLNPFSWNKKFRTIPKVFWDLQVDKAYPSEFYYQKICIVPNELLTYSKALRCTFSRTRKNLCISKFVELELLNRVREKSSKSLAP